MRRKGIPYGPDCCSPSKHCVKAINNVSPDPNGDLTLKAGNGIAISQTGDDEITITNSAASSSFVAGDNIEINPAGDNFEIRVTDDVSINNLNVAGDIIQQGSAYETHAEKVFTTNDYIYMRDGAVGGLAVGSFSGFQVEKYDGTNDGRLVIDKDGTARVGDVGDEQPLLTRDESADLTNDNLMKWDAVNQKAVDSGISTNDIDDALDTKVNKTQYNLDMAGKVSGSGNIGTDTKPVKIVNGVAVPVSADLETPFSNVKYAYITFSIASSNAANQWREQAGTVGVASGSPYFAVSSGGGIIKILQDGYYLIHAKLANGISLYEGISRNGNIIQNAVHNSEIVTIDYLSANSTVTAALYTNAAGSGYFESYNGLNKLEIIRL